MGGCVSIDRIISKLDEHLGRNDYAAAERHLLYWIGEAEGGCDTRTELSLRNELIGLYRKLGRKEDAFATAHSAISKIETLGIENSVSAATSYLNTATVYKAFSKADEGFHYFERAREIYERELEPTDRRLGGLYNNMGLSLVDMRRFDEAYELYNRAISIMQGHADGAPEVAITYLNMASAAEAESGLVDADEKIQGYLDIAKELLENYPTRDGYYAFVCEKCASVFGYYGRFFYENELTERARRIYEGT